MRFDARETAVHFDLEAARISIRSMAQNETAPEVFFGFVEAILFDQASPQRHECVPVLIGLSG